MKAQTTKDYRRCENCQTMVDMQCFKVPSGACGYQPIYSLGEADHAKRGGISGIQRGKTHNIIGKNH